MKKLLIAITAAFFVSTAASAQLYSKALGIRVNHGYGGITYKHFITTDAALDWTFQGSSSENSGWIGVTGLYEIHKPTSFIPRLNWYYGIGGHLSLGSTRYNYLGTSDNYSTIGFGVDGVLGLEYTISEIPFALSLDYIPSYSFQSTSRPDNLPEPFEWDSFSSGAYFGNWTFGIKYIFHGGIRAEAPKKQ